MKCQKARNRGRNYHDVFKDRFSVSKIGLCIINKHNDVERIGIEEIASSTKRVELTRYSGMVSGIWNRVRLLQRSTCIGDSRFAILTKKKKLFFHLRTK